MEIRVLSAKTEAEITQSLQQLQITLAAAQELIQRGDRVLAKVERMIDALSTAGAEPRT